MQLGTLECLCAHGASVLSNYLNADLRWGSLGSTGTGGGSYVGGGGRGAQSPSESPAVKPLLECGGLTALVEMVRIQRLLHLHPTGSEAAARSLEGLLLRTLVRMGKMPTPSLRPPGKANAWRPASSLFALFLPFFLSRWPLSLELCVISTSIRRSISHHRSRRVVSCFHGTLPFGRRAHGISRRAALLAWRRGLGGSHRRHRRDGDLRVFVGRVARCRRSEGGRSPRLGSFLRGRARREARK